MSVPAGRPIRAFSRRRLLEAGGLAATCGGVLAACGGGDSGGSEPGRVGYAPPATPLPIVETNDIVYVRTATSMEYLMLDLYATITESGDLDEEAQALIDRFVEDHTAAAEATAALTVAAGGEPYECANSWYSERVVPEILEAVTGNPELDIPPSDEPAADMLRISYGFETMMSSMYQQMIELVVDRLLRAELGGLGATDARHSAAVALVLTGVPDGYVSPVVLGGEETPDESGRAELYAIPGRFSLLSSTEIVIGAPNAAGTRSGFALETPADNAFVYEGMTCSE